MDKFFLTIGNFDGVHIGHQKLLQRLVQEARQNNALPVVITFDGLVSRVITPVKEKIFLLQSYGIKIISIIHFDKFFAMTTPEDFFKKYLIQQFNVSKIFVGYNFRFGAYRLGDVRLLSKLCSENKILFEVIPAVKYRNKTVSSSLIRKLLLAGNVELANTLLGRIYSIDGRVIKGQGIGTKIGFPTLNIQIDEKKFYPTGVYYAQINFNSDIYPCLANIGYKPTVSSGKSLSVEAHIIPGTRVRSDTGNKLNNHKELPYFRAKIHSCAKIMLMKYLRCERQFADIMALCNQIKADISRIDKMTKKSFLLRM